MDTVEGRLLLAQQPLGRRHVGRQHALLDQAVSIIALHRHDTLDPLLVVELDTGFGGIEVDGAPRRPLGLQGLEEAIELLQVGHQILVALALFGVAIQQGRHIVVDQSRMGSHHGGEELCTFHRAGAVDIELTGHAEPIHLRIDGAEPVGEHLRQHGDDPVGEVDRVTARPRLLVQGGTGGHIVGDVGDTDQ